MLCRSLPLYVAGQYQQVTPEHLAATVISLSTCCAAHLAWKMVGCSCWMALSQHLFRSTPAAGNNMLQTLMQKHLTQLVQSTLQLPTFSLGLHNRCSNFGYACGRTCQAGAVVACHHAVRVEHGHQLEHKAAPQPLRQWVVRHQKVHSALGQMCKQTAVMCMNVTWVVTGGCDASVLSAAECGAFGEASRGRPVHSVRARWAHAWPRKRHVLD